MSIGPLIRATLPLLIRATLARRKIFLTPRSEARNGQIFLFQLIPGLGTSKYICFDPFRASERVETFFSVVPGLGMSQNIYV
jgi:hypothetical protein